VRKNTCALLALYCFSGHVDGAPLRFTGSVTIPHAAIRAICAGARNETIVLTARRRDETRRAIEAVDGDTQKRFLSASATTKRRLQRATFVRFGVSTNLVRTFEGYSIDSASRTARSIRLFIGARGSTFNERTEGASGLFGGLLDPRAVRADHRWEARDQDPPTLRQPHDDREPLPTTCRGCPRQAGVQRARTRVDPRSLLRALDQPHVRCCSSACRTRIHAAIL
jgi:hypothetical protein